MLDDPILKALYDYWRSKGKPGAFPSRKDIDPTEIPKLLPHIMLIDVRDNRLFMRLVGTQVAVGTDPTGTDMMETAPSGAYGNHITQLFRRAVDEARPLYTAFDYSHPEKEQTRLAKRLLLPLSEDQKEIDMLMIGQIVVAPRYIQRSLWQIKPEMIREVEITPLDY